MAELIVRNNPLRNTFESTTRDLAREMRRLMMMMIWRWWWRYIKHTIHIN